MIPFFNCLQIRIFGFLHAFESAARAAPIKAGTFHRIAARFAGSSAEFPIFILLTHQHLVSIILLFVDASTKRRFA
jgi:hypothetical protein